MKYRCTWVFHHKQHIKNGSSGHGAEVELPFYDLAKAREALQRKVALELNAPADWRHVTITTLHAVEAQTH